MDSVATRRRLIASLIASAGITSLAGCSGGGEEGDDSADGGDGGGDSGGDGEASGEPDVEPDETVLVGPEGETRFDPETLEIDPGTAVEFVWESGGHNLIPGEIPDDAEWSGVQRRQDEGYGHVHTFDPEGRYEIFCGPHQFQGMTGEVFVGDVESAAEGDDGGNESEADGNETEDDGNETDGGGETSDGGNETDGNETGDGNETSDGADGNETDGGNESDDEN